ncbi:O-antigen translocase [Flavobacterium lacisediminis]|uniref:O-antigen translocase n=1 Tax=Flavobacterium lacisediminis TaxID=2989705 RepID=A0ABT3EGC4_9FLAO|nr:O-antigen translocase [Flavobacterium lacisediminis]
MSFFNRHILLKVLSLNAIAVFVQFVLGLISVNIVSVYLGPNGMALMGNLRNFTSIFKSISIVGLKEGFIKIFIENKETEQRKKIFSTFLAFFGIVTIVSSLVIIIFASNWSELLFQTDVYTDYLILFGLLLPFFTLQSFLAALLNAQQFFKKLIGLQLVSSIVIFALTTYLTIRNQLDGAVLTLVISDVVLLICTLFFLHKNEAFQYFNTLKNIDFTYLKSIQKFLLMALVSAIVIPLTSLLIRNLIISDISLDAAGNWEAVNRISGFYMMFFSAGLSMYYLPKLSELKTDIEFKKELLYYFKTLVPLFVIVLFVVFVAKNWILDIVLASKFQMVKSLLIWQLLGDLFKIMTLAFGYQILVKAMVNKYLIVEIVFNVLFYMGVLFLLKYFSVEGAVMAYFYANVITFLVVLYFFRKLIYVKKS